MSGFVQAESWGLDGYIHLEFGKNACQIASCPIAAIIDNNPSTTSSGSGYSSSSFDEGYE